MTASTGTDAAKAYYEWNKAVWRSGSKPLCQAGPTVAALLTFGDWGHHCRPSFTTLAALGGVSVSTVARRVRLFRSAGLLHARARPGATTVFCLGRLANKTDSAMPYGERCPVCDPEVTPVAHDRGGAAPMTDNQESFQDDAWQPLTPAVPALQDDGDRLTELLWLRRPSISNDDLVLFQHSTRHWLTQQSFAQLERNTADLAKARVITQRSIDSFLGRRASRGHAGGAADRSTAAAARVAFIRTSILDWCRDAPDVEVSKAWFLRVMDASDDQLEELLSAWQAVATRP